jgi:hypothetical protein
MASSRMGALAKGVNSRSRAAIVAPRSSGAVLGMQRRRHRNAGAARNRRREPERRLRGSALVVGVLDALYRFEARSFGFIPRSVGSEANGARRFAGCGVRLER